MAGLAKLGRANVHAREFEELIKLGLGRGICSLDRMDGYEMNAYDFALGSFWRTGRVRVMRL